MLKFLFVVVAIFVAFKVAFFAIDFAAGIFGGFNTFLLAVAAVTAFGFIVIDAKPKVSGEHDDCKACVRKTDKRA